MTKENVEYLVNLINDNAQFGKDKAGLRNVIDLWWETFKNDDFAVLKKIVMDLLITQIRNVCCIAIVLEKLNAYKKLCVTKYNEYIRWHTRPKTCEYCKETRKEGCETVFCWNSEEYVAKREETNLTENQIKRIKEILNIK